MVVQLVARPAVSHFVVQPLLADVFLEYIGVYRRAGCRRFDVAGTPRCSSLRSSAQGGPELIQMAVV
eukprot:4942122-Pyramimonas_sp.AAC.1